MVDIIGDAAMVPSVSAPNPRRLVIRGLARLERSPETMAQATLRTLLDGPDAKQLDPRDRGLVTECFYGILRWRLQLDAVIASRAKKGVPKDPELANLLRLGIFQLLHLDRVPERAAVHTTVSLARKMRGDRVGGFVNGVLRGVLRDRPTFETPAERWAHPQWMVDRFRAEVGDDALESRLKANMTPAPVTIRICAGGEPPEGSVPTATAGVFNYEGDNRILRSGFRSGAWLPQDEASARVAGLLDAQPGQRVLELCAGRGMKSSQLAEIIGESGLLVSSDRSGSKLAEALRLTERWAPKTPHFAFAADASAPLPLHPDTRFDRILIDAPCSGLGVIRRRPETLWNRRPEDVSGLAQLQRGILGEAMRWLAPGGQLVYAVCTTTPEETTEHLVGRTVTESFVTRPEVDGCDGFFAARIEASP
jgi:16S rRNA (cytosine967-C5)-methyltransferase